jgi:carboxyl-terminal processing protease
MNKNLKFTALFFVSAVLMGATLFALQDNQKKVDDKTQEKPKILKPNSDLNTITKLASTIISKQHYLQRELDDEMSKKLFNEYFKFLDPNKMFFTREDIKRFEKYKLQLDDQAFDGNLEFAFDVYNFFLKRLEEYEAYTNKLLDKGFDFKKDENFVLDRTEKNWPKNKAEMLEIWRKKIKYDILAMKLLERATKEHAEKNKKDAAHPSWSKKTPDERIKSRIAHFVSNMKQKEPIDVLELYLSSLARVYDPHSSYMAPKTEEDFNIEMQLSLVGIGALLSSEDGYTKIESLIPGGPAEKDGRLKAEDRIVAVAQDKEEPVDIVDMSLTKVVRLIRGQKGTKVHLTVLDGKKGMYAPPKMITIVRDTVKLNDREAKGKIETIKGKDGKDYKIGIITLSSFYMDFDAAARGEKDFKSTTRDIKKILERFNKEKIDGLIMDLRSNGGGSLTEAIRLTGLFIKEGPVVQVKGSFGELDVKYDRDEDVSYKGPMAVLLNRFSASAAEIFAGAIQDYKRGILLGDAHTHGKGLVQTIYDLQSFLAFLGAKFPAGAIKFTNAKFYRINGSSTQIKGVSPDIIFPSFTDNMEIGEAHLDYALPWDAIESVKHEDYVDNLSTIIPKLQKQSLERRKKDKEFDLLKKDIETYDKLRKKKKISLNEEKRWTEFQKEKKLLEERKKLMKLENEDSKKEKDSKKDENDLYLDETKKIMSDYIDILKPKPSLGANK